MSLLRGWLVESGLDAAYVEWLMLGVELLLVAVLAVVADYIVKRVVLSRVTAFARRSESHWDDRVLEHRVIQRLAHVAPAIVIFLSADLVLADFAAAASLARRAALVRTVGLNTRARGGTGDAARTLAVCRLLADDHEDMVQKAMSWALRTLVVHDREAVSEFLQDYDDFLAARVKREVRNKLETGLKNPRPSR